MASIFQRAGLAAFPTRSVALSAVACLLAFLADTMTPRGVATGILYVGVVFCGRLFQAPRAIYVFAALGTLLTALGFFIKAPSLVPDWMVVVNRGLCMASIWLVAVIVHQGRMAERRARDGQTEAALAGQIVTSSDDAIVRVDLSGAIKYWNHGAEKLYGYRSSEILGNSIVQLIPEDLRSDEEYFISEILHGRNVDHFETKRLCKDGATVEVSLSISPVRDETGRIVGASKIARDITERRRADAALAASEERYDLAVRGMSVGLWDWNVKADSLYWTPKLLDILGVAEDQFEPRFEAFESRLHPQDRERAMAALNAHLRGEAPFDVDIRVRRQDGEYRWIHSTGQASWDENGRPARMVGSVDDITESYRAEERFRLIVRLAPYAIIMSDQAGRILLTNHETERLFGYDADELKALKIEDLLPERYRGRHPSLRSGFFGEPRKIDPQARAMGPGQDLWALRKDGGEVAVEIWLIPMETDEGMRVLSAVIDVTQRRQIEDERRRMNEVLESRVAERTVELARANHELEEFAFVASHDLKAPLRVIHNAAKWLEADLEPHLDDESRENLALLQGRARRMEKLLDDLLDYSRIGRKFDAAYSETISGDELMQDVLGLLAPPKTFAVKVDAAFAKIRTSRMPLQQILYNLINNSIKHHHKGSGSVEVSVVVEPERYTFAVKDDGPGIPERFKSDIFKMFQTLKPRDQVEGSGMGLAMVKKQVELFGGELELESVEGDGATFRFTWPRNRQPLGDAACA